MNFTTNDLIIVLSREPLLTADGIGIEWKRRRDPLESAALEYAARAELFDRIAVIGEVVEWLRPRPKLAGVTSRSHSYELKHECEREIGRYITNGELIAAAIHLDFAYRRCGTYRPTVNAILNIGNTPKPPRRPLELA